MSTRRRSALVDQLVKLGLTVGEANAYPPNPRTRGRSQNQAILVQAVTGFMFTTRMESFRYVRYLLGIEGIRYSYRISPHIRYLQQESSPVRNTQYPISLISLISSFSEHVNALREHLNRVHEDVNKRVGGTIPS